MHSTLIRAYVVLLPNAMTNVKDAVATQRHVPTAFRSPHQSQCQFLYALVGAMQKSDPISQTTKEMCPQLPTIPGAWNSSRIALPGEKKGVECQTLKGGNHHHENQAMSGHMTIIDQDNGRVQLNGMK